MAEKAVVAGFDEASNKRLETDLRTRSQRSRAGPAQPLR